MRRVILGLVRERPPENGSSSTPDICFVRNGCWSPIARASREKNLRRTDTFPASPIAITFLARLLSLLGKRTDAAARREETVAVGDGE